MIRYSLTSLLAVWPDTTYWKEKNTTMLFLFLFIVVFFVGLFGKQKR